MVDGSRLSRGLMAPSALDETSQTGKPQRNERARKSEACERRSAQTNSVEHHSQPPAWSDQQATTMPIWLGGCRVGDRSLEFLRHPGPAARPTPEPLATSSGQSSAIFGHSLAAWPPSSLFAPGSCVPGAPVPRLAPAENGESNMGVSSFPPLTVFPHWLTGCSSR